jgi:hypothetical protein
MSAEKSIRISSPALLSVLLYRFSREEATRSTTTERIRTALTLGVRAHALVCRLCVTIARFCTFGPAAENKGLPTSCIGSASYNALRYGTSQLGLSSFHSLLSSRTAILIVDTPVCDCKRFILSAASCCTLPTINLDNYMGRVLL